MFQKFLASLLIVSFLLTSAPAGVYAELSRSTLRGESIEGAGLEETLARALQDPAKTIQRFTQYLAPAPTSAPTLTSAAGLEEVTVLEVTKTIGDLSAQMSVLERSRNRKDQQAAVDALKLRGFLDRDVNALRGMPSDHPERDKELTQRVRQWLAQARELLERMKTPPDGTAKGSAAGRQFTHRGELVIGLIQVIEGIVQEHKTAEPNVKIVPLTLDDVDSRILKLLVNENYRRRDRIATNLSRLAASDEVIAGGIIERGDRRGQYDWVAQSSEPSAEPPAAGLEELFKDVQLEDPRVLTFASDLQTLVVAEENRLLGLPLHEGGKSWVVPGLVHPVDVMYIPGRLNKEVVVLEGEPAQLRFFSLNGNTPAPLGTIPGLVHPRAVVHVAGMKNLNLIVLEGGDADRLRGFNLPSSAETDFKISKLVNPLDAAYIPFLHELAVLEGPPANRIRLFFIGDAAKPPRTISGLNHPLGVTYAPGLRQLIVLEGKPANRLRGFHALSGQESDLKISGLVNPRDAVYIPQRDAFVFLAGTPIRLHSVPLARRKVPRPRADLRRPSATGLEEDRYPPLLSRTPHVVAVGKSKLRYGTKDGHVQFQLYKMPGRQGNLQISMGKPQRGVVRLRVREGPFPVGDNPNPASVTLHRTLEIQGHLFFARMDEDLNTPLIQGISYNPSSRELTLTLDPKTKPVKWLSQETPKKAYQIEIPASSGEIEVLKLKLRLGKSTARAGLEEEFLKEASGRILDALRSTGPVAAFSQLFPKLIGEASEKNIPEAVPQALLAVFRSLQADSEKRHLTGSLGQAMMMGLHEFSEDFEPDPYPSVLPGRTTIWTVTTSPTIDIDAKRKLANWSDRKGVLVDPGGGGINVAIALARRGVRARPVFFYTGETGKLLVKLIENRGVFVHPGDAIELKGNEQTRVTIVTSLDKAGSLVPKGTPVDEEARRQMVARLLDPQEGVKTGDIVAISGSLAPGLPDDFYADLGKRLVARGAIVVVDTKGAPAKAVLFSKPAAATVYSQNNLEFGELVGVNSNDTPALVAKAKEIIEAQPTDQAMKEIVITKGAGGAFSVTREKVLEVSAPKVEAVSEVGAGDTSLAERLFRTWQGKEHDAGFVYGVAAGTSSVLHPGTGGGLQAEVDHYAEHLGLTEQTRVKTLQSEADMEDTKPTVIGLNSTTTRKFLALVEAISKNTTTDLRNSSAVEGLLRNWRHTRGEWLKGKDLKIFQIDPEGYSFEEPKEQKPLVQIFFKGDTWDEEEAINLFGANLMGWAEAPFSEQSAADAEDVPEEESNSPAQEQTKQKSVVMKVRNLKQVIGNPDAPDEVELLVHVISEVDPSSHQVRRDLTLSLLTKTFGELADQLLPMLAVAGQLAAPGVIESVTSPAAGLEEKRYRIYQDVISVEPTVNLGEIGIPQVPGLPLIQRVRRNHPQFFRERLPQIKQSISGINSLLVYPPGFYSYAVDPRSVLPDPIQPFRISLQDTKGNLALAVEVALIVLEEMYPDAQRVTRLEIRTGSYKTQGSSGPALLLGATGIYPATGLEERGNSAVMEAGQAIRELSELREAHAMGTGYLFLDGATVAIAWTLSAGGLEESQPLPVAAVVNPAEYHTLMAIAEASGLEEGQIRRWTERYLFRYDSPLTKESAIESARGALALRIPSARITILDTLSQAMSEFGRAINAILRSFGINLDYKKLQTLTNALYQAAQA